MGRFFHCHVRWTEILSRVSQVPATELTKTLLQCLWTDARTPWICCVGDFFNGCYHGKSPSHHNLEEVCFYFFQASNNKQIQVSWTYSWPRCPMALTTILSIPYIFQSILLMSNLVPDGLAMLTLLEWKYTQPPPLTKSIDVDPVPNVSQDGLHL